MVRNKNRATYPTSVSARKLDIFFGFEVLRERKVGMLIVVMVVG